MSVVRFFNCLEQKRRDVLGVCGNLRNKFSPIDLDHAKFSLPLKIITRKESSEQSNDHGCIGINSMCTLYAREVVCRKRRYARENISLQLGTTDEKKANC